MPPGVTHYSLRIFNDAAELKRMFSAPTLATVNSLRIFNDAAELKRVAEPHVKRPIVGLRIFNDAAELKLLPRFAQISVGERVSASSTMRPN